MSKRLWSLTLIASVLVLGLGLSACNNDEPEAVLEPEVTEPAAMETTEVEVETEGGEVEGVMAEEPLAEDETAEPMEPGMEAEAPAEAPAQ